MIRPKAQLLPLSMFSVDPLKTRNARVNSMKCVVSTEN